LCSPLKNQNLFFLKTIFIIRNNKEKQVYTKKPMAASFLPSILVPLVGLVFPAIAMASLFLYIEQDQIS
jgi:photosystem I subunit 8